MICPLSTQHVHHPSRCVMRASRIQMHASECVMLLHKLRNFEDCRCWLPTGSAELRACAALLPSSTGSTQVLPTRRAREPPARATSVPRRRCVLHMKQMARKAPIPEELMVRQFPRRAPTCT